MSIMTNDEFCNQQIIPLQYHQLSAKHTGKLSLIEYNKTATKLAKNLGNPRVSCFEYIVYTKKREVTIFEYVIYTKKMKLSYLSIRCKQV